MAIALNEDEAGRNREIWYPNLRTCLGFTVVLDDGNLLGAHLTMPTTLKQVQNICEYFNDLLGEADIVSILLIGDISEWTMKAEEQLRSGGNLCRTLRETMKTACGIYRYDSVQSAAGGRGAAVHLIHRGGRHPYPYVDLFEPDSWSIATWIDTGDPMMESLEIKRSYSAKQMGQQNGMRVPNSVAVMQDVGKKTSITEGMMQKM